MAANGLVDGLACVLAGALLAGLGFVIVQLLDLGRSFREYRASHDEWRKTVDREVRRIPQLAEDLSGFAALLEHHLTDHPGAHR